MGKSGTPVSIKNVADGVDPYDAVNKEQLDALSSTVSTITPALKYLRFGSTDAKAANALGTDSLAIGGNAYASQTGSLAFGRDSVSSGVNSLALGLRANAGGKNSVALGQGSSTDEENTVSVGNIALQRRITNVAAGSTATDAVNLEQVQQLVSAATAPVQQLVKSTRLSATLLGAQAAPVLSDLVAVGTTDKLGQTEADGTDAVAVGLGAHANNDNTVAVGTNVAAGGIGAVAIGNLSVAGGLSSTAIGVNAQAVGDYGVSIGNSTKASETNTVAIGNASFVGLGGTNGVAIGYKNTVTGAGTIVLGNQVSAKGANSVVLGSGSDGSQDNVVSVGGTATGTQRKIVNVAAGTTTTDAVNYGQLNAAIASVGTGGSSLVTQTGTGDVMVASAVGGTHVDFAGTGNTTRELINISAGTKDSSAVALSQLKPVVAGLGGGASVNETTGAVTGPTYHVQNGTQSTVGDALTSLDTSLNDLKTQINTTTGAGLVMQKDNTDGDITIGANTGGNVINVSSNAHTRKITGVANGDLTSSSVDAVNGSQLYNAASGLATAIGGGAALNGDGTITQPSFIVDGKPVHNVGDAVSNLDGRVTNNTNSLTQLQTTVNNITNAGGVASPNAVSYDTSAHDVITLGKDGAGATLTNLKDATLSADSTDAVTGKQLFDTNNTVASLQDSIQNIASTGSTSIGINGTNGTNGANGVDGAPAAASASGNDAIAMGDNASASGDHAVVIGGGASGTADGVIAIGGNSNASGKDSIAIGNGATAPATNAVALGAGSVADRDNTVSMGSEGKERQITNVAAGTQGTDAVNLNQMNSAVGGVARKAYSGIAAATALTMIPDVDANKTLSIGIGGGTFQGYAATAIGGTARITQNIKVRVGAGWSAAGTTVGAGASYQW